MSLSQNQWQNIFVRWRHIIKSLFYNFLRIFIIACWKWDSSHLSVDHQCNRVLSSAQDGASRFKTWELASRQRPQHQADRFRTRKLDEGQYRPGYSMWFTQLRCTRGHLWPVLLWLGGGHLVLWRHSLRYDLREFAVWRRTTGRSLHENQAG